ncbi:hypothetical protein GMJLKIPL_6501 [Methylobacterium isbiliense]|uniref:Uncharacterized protein n=1 Tax=Methylobacterium isbiliense TaxID=315478 RepID=A0ABQ4SN16_9HYPH|nr:hypothetical protein GMJLKIPL_6501 [Methylobacterium isbiliense]
MAWLVSDRQTRVERASLTRYVDLRRHRTSPECGGGGKLSSNQSGLSARCRCLPQNQSLVPLRWKVAGFSHTAH